MLFNSYPGPPQPPPQFQQQQFSSSFSAQSAGAPVYAQAPNSANPGGTIPAPPYADAGGEGTGDGMGQSGKNLWGKAKSGLKLVREQSKASVASLKRSASIAATGSTSSEIGATSRGLDSTPPPPAYAPAVDLPPAYPGTYPPPPYPLNAQGSQGNVGIAFDPPPPSMPNNTSPLRPGFNPDPPPHFLPPPNDLHNPVHEHSAPQGERIQHAVFTCLAVCCILGVIAAWLCWIIIPMLWITTGRHEVKNNWDVSNCTLLAQNCYKKCSGCGCPDSCCGSATDCTRSSYSMSQNCVWLSNSKFVQDPHTFQVEVEINDLIAAGLRLSGPTSLAVSAAMVLGSGLLIGLVPRSKRMWVAVGVVLLAGSVSARSGGDSCECEERFITFIRWEIPLAADAPNGTEPLRFSKEYSCANENDDRAFCKDYFKHRGKSCRSLEDLAEKEYCQESYLNTVGKSITCYINPDDPTESELQGSKGHGKGNVIALAIWGAFTFCFCLPILCDSFLDN